MELLNQHTLNSIGRFEFSINIRIDGAQSPSIRFFKKEMEILSKLFVLHENSLEDNWYTTIHDKFKKIDNQKFEKDLSPLELEKIKELVARSNYILKDEINNTLSKKGNSLVVEESCFILEKIKHFNVEELFKIYGFLDLQFDQIELDIQDILYIKIRKSKAIIMDCLNTKNTIVVDSMDVLELIRIWTQCVALWKADEIPNLKFPGTDKVHNSYSF